MFPSYFYMRELSFPGYGWTPVCPWKVVEILILLCLVSWLLLYLLSYLYLSPWVFPLLLLVFHFQLTVGERESGCVGSSCQQGLNHSTFSFYSGSPQYNSEINFLWQLGVSRIRHCCNIIFHKSLQSRIGLVLSILFTNKNKNVGPAI